MDPKLRNTLERLWFIAGMIAVAGVLVFLGFGWAIAGLFILAKTIKGSGLTGTFDWGGFLGAVLGVLGLGVFTVYQTLHAQRVRDAERRRELKIELYELREKLSALQRQLDVFAYFRLDPAKIGLDSYFSDLEDNL